MSKKEESLGRIFVVDFIYDGQLIKSLREIGMDFIGFDKCSSFYEVMHELEKLGFNKSDSLVLFIPGSLICLVNEWFNVQLKNHGQQGRIGNNLLYQLRLNSASDPMLQWGHFNNGLLIEETDPQIAALKIKRHFGQIPKTPDWDTYFMSMAYLVAMRSKDANTHIGAVVVDNSNNVVSTGYNSFPRNIDDSRLERQVRPEKYFWFNHAEENAVANAAYIGTSLRGCRMYTNGIPCMERCAGPIINSGIKEVIVDANWNNDNGDKWQQQALKTKELFAEADVEIRFWKGKILKIQKYRRGRLFD